jgi:hypothetical protein
MVFVAVAAIYFIETTRKINNLHEKTFSPVCYDEDKIAVSNNDFIFFESISKYLLGSLRR